MNALVSFRANAAGNLSVRREERMKAQESIVSNFRAKLEGIQRALEGDAIAKSAGSLAAKSASASSGAKANTSTQRTDDDLPNNELGRDAYLQLLVEQLSNQDPLEPMDNQAMIAQLAQFSSLEQMQNLNETFADNFETLAGNIDQLNFISAQGLLGKFVEGVGTDGKVLSGTVESVHLDGSIVMLTVAGKPMSMSGVVGITTPQAADTAEEAAKSIRMRGAGS